MRIPSRSHYQATKKLKTHAYGKDPSIQIKKPMRIPSTSHKQAAKKLKTHAYNKDIAILIKKPMRIACFPRKTP